jgi:hypothetical protein
MPIVLKSGSLKFLKPLGSVQVYTGITLLFISREQNRGSVTLSVGIASFEFRLLLAVLITIFFALHGKMSVFRCRMQCPSCSILRF